MSLFRQKRFSLPDPVQEACAKFKASREHRYHQHRKFARRIHIDRASVNKREEFLQTIPTISLPQLVNEYPPHHHDVCETKEIETIWTNYRNGRKHPDPREARAMDGTWAPTLILDETRLQKVVEEDESVIIHDSETGKVVGVVIRNVCGDPGVLAWVTSVIQENVGWRRNVRVCDCCLLTNSH